MNQNNETNLSYLTISILLGVLFDILFFQKSLGISYLLFVIAFYLAFLVLLRRKITFKFNFGWFLSIPILALSATYLIFSNWIFQTINFILIPVLIIGQTVLITGENKYKWFEFLFLDDIFHGIFTRSFSHIQKFFSLGFSVLFEKKSGKKNDVGKKIFIGLAISIPLILIILSLLASGDLVFGEFLDKIVIWIQKLNLAIFIKQFFLILFISVIAFSYFNSFFKSRKNLQVESQESKIGSKGTMDPVITVTVLSLVNLVYLLFILVQFAYMFGAIKNALPPEYSYAEYARKGFFELLTVTLINFVILLVGITFKPKDSKVVDKVIQTLHSLLVVSTIVLLVSAFSRMSLYEAAFGYTYLRVLTHSFMMLLFVLFLIALYKIWNDRIHLLKSYIVISLVAYLVLNFVNIDVFIINKNLDRFSKTGDLDEYYLTTLSYDSIPPIINFSKKKDLGNHMVQFLNTKLEELWKEKEWQSFSLSKQKALKSLIDRYR